MSEQLLALERGSCSNPPKIKERDIALALRGGAAILMVASFEQFLKDSYETNLNRLIGNPPLVEFNSLPEQMQVATVFKSLEYAMKGDRRSAATTKHSRLPSIERAASLVVAKMVNPSVFAETSSNPGPETVKAMFKDVGIEDVFRTIKPKFDRKWRSPTANTFLQDKLTEIVRRRNVIAHSADALGITRNDLQEALRFLKALAAILDQELETHISKILNPPP